VHLIDEHLGEDLLGASAGDGGIELPVEPVGRGAVHKEAEAREAEEAVPVARRHRNGSQLAIVYMELTLGVGRHERTSPISASE
jgi:hypothetical protein